MSLDEALAEDLAQLEGQGLSRRMRPVRGAQAAIVDVDGRRAINFSSNNYLGLADHPELAAAEAVAARSLGTGAGASRLIVGSLEPHRALEAALAHVFGRPALLFNSGYQANVGLLQALAGPGDILFCDRLNHASLIDGARLSRAELQVFPHGDLAALDAALATHARRARRAFVVSDTVFSMDGDLADVVGLRQLADRHGAYLLVDEAHAVGVLGPGGRGVCAAAGVTPDALMGTFGKALGTFGAFVSANPRTIDWLVHRARSFVFTTAIPPGVAAAAAAALDLVTTSRGEERRRALHARTLQFAAGLSRLGLRGDAPPTSAVFPVLIGDAAATMRVSESLLERGIFAQGIRPPTVPPGTSRLRFSLMATHTEAQIVQALAALDELLRAGDLPRPAPAAAAR